MEPLTSGAELSDKDSVLVAMNTKPSLTNKLQRELGHFVHELSPCNMCRQYCNYGNMQVLSAS